MDTSSDRRRRANVDAIAKAQDDLVTDRFESGVLFALIIHTAALWGMSSPDVLADVDLSDAHERLGVVRESVAASGVTNRRFSAD